MAAALPPPVTSSANPPLRLLEVEAGAGSEEPGAPGASAVEGLEGLEGLEGVDGVEEAEGVAASADAVNAAGEPAPPPPPPPQATSTSEVNKAPAARARCNSWFVFFNFFMIFFVSRCPGMKDELSDPRAVPICTLRAGIAFLFLLADASALLSETVGISTNEAARPIQGRHICRLWQSDRTNACCPAWGRIRSSKGREGPYVARLRCIRTPP